VNKDKGVQLEVELKNAKFLLQEYQKRVQGITEERNELLKTIEGVKAERDRLSSVHIESNDNVENLKLKINSLEVTVLYHLFEHELKCYLPGTQYTTPA
jgi:chromosome segregation ATPase